MSKINCSLRAAHFRELGRVLGLAVIDADINTPSMNTEFEGDHPHEMIWPITTRVKSRLKSFVCIKYLHYLTIKPTVGLKYV